MVSTMQRNDGEVWRYTIEEAHQKSGAAILLVVVGSHRDLWRDEVTYEEDTEKLRGLGIERCGSG